MTPTEERRLYELELLAQLTKRRADSEYDTECAVRRAREYGATWEQIGTALGVTHQAVRQRFSKMVLD
jgi:hypothetical protein